jgi:hypothetical protein
MRFYCVLFFYFALNVAGFCANIPTMEVFSEPSWVFGNKQIEVAVTQSGGMMAPVKFYADTNAPVQPYYINPWYGENLKIDLPLLRSLRGDFFCFPFGNNTEPFNGEKHVPHGQTAGEKWNFKSMDKTGAVTSLVLEMQTKTRPGKVTKKVNLIDGQNVIYTEHILENYSGQMPLGHHAILYVPDKPGAILVSTSPFKLGMTCPVLFSNPENREYQSFAIGKEFTDLRHVPLLQKDPAEADCTAFPARTGFTDLLGIFSVSSEKLDNTPAWTTAVNTEDGYLWFSMKNPDILPATLFWISNHGRHGSPWNGRNRCLGLEDMCGFFAEGLAASANPNLLNERGIKTTISLAPDKPMSIKYIQGVVKIPSLFGRVKQLNFMPDNNILFISENGLQVKVNVNYSYVYTGILNK